MICLDLANRPYTYVSLLLWHLSILKHHPRLPCRHFFCADCISLFANNLAKRRVNFHCPYCQITIGRFTPIDSLYMSARACTLREELNLPSVSRSSLTWPQEFTPRQARLPFQDASADEVIVLDFWRLSLCSRYLIVFCFVLYQFPCLQFIYIDMISVLKTLAHSNNIAFLKTWNDLNSCQQGWIIENRILRICYILRVACLHEVWHGNRYWDIFSSSHRNIGNFTTLHPL